MYMYVLRYIYENIIYKNMRFYNLYTGVYTYLLLKVCHYICCSIKDGRLGSNINIYIDNAFDHATIIDSFPTFGLYTDLHTAVNNGRVCVYVFIYHTDMYLPPIGHKYHEYMYIILAYVIYIYIYVQPMTLVHI